MMKRLMALLLMPLAAHAGADASLYDLESVWINQREEAVSLRGLAGKPAVICMFFSHCTYACPRITSDMKAIESALDAGQRTNVAFVMASFDAKRDTPSALKEFASAKSLGDRWQLLHGDEYAVRELAAALDIRFREESEGAFAHSNMITVLDREGRVIFRREGLEGDLSPTIHALLSLLNR